eukprot:GEMP01132584.1.p2 GENE.GEMP01132584.1~~GEMP01132584.1.p2  ORF type:complete len:107 (-),score=3.02 GEMP01132584.1:26-346(-)
MVDTNARTKKRNTLGFVIVGYWVYSIQYIVRGQQKKQHPISTQGMKNAINTRSYHRFDYYLGQYRVLCIGCTLYTCTLYTYLSIGRTLPIYWVGHKNPIPNIRPSG